MKTSRQTAEATRLIRKAATFRIQEGDRISTIRPDGRKVYETVVSVQDQAYLVVRSEQGVEHKVGRLMVEAA